MQPRKEWDCSLGQGFTGGNTVVLRAYIGSCVSSRFVKASRGF